jgi:hypothetical protein
LSISTFHCLLREVATLPPGLNPTPLFTPPGFRTQFQGYSVRFSPFEETKLAVATSQNFGIIGNGRQYVLQVASQTVGLFAVLLSAYRHAVDRFRACCQGATQCPAAYSQGIGFRVG